MKRKLLVSLFFSIFLLAIFIFSPTKAEAYSKCYTTDAGGGSILIGDMDTWMKLPVESRYWNVDFLAIDGDATVEFADKAGDVVADEVFFKTGNNYWVPFQSKATYYSWDWGRNYTAYFLNFSPGANDDCANYYVNVRWRSLKDGKIHYCDDISSNYQARQEAPASLNSSTYDYYGSLAGGGRVALYDRNMNYVSFQAMNCKEYNLYLNKQIASGFSSYNEWCVSNDIILAEQPVGSSFSIKIFRTGGNEIIAGSLYQESGTYGVGSLHILKYPANPLTVCGGCQYCGPPPVPPTVCTTCPCTQTQEGGSCKYSLTNVYESASNPDYRPYVEFTPKVTGKVTKFYVKAGNWGNAWRSITCKVRDVYSGEESPERSSAQFQASSGIQWRTLDFTSSPVQLTENRPYRLYCRGPSNEAYLTLYWMYACGDPVYGKDYKWDMTICPGPLTCSSATLSPSSFTLEPTQTQVVQVTGLTGSLALLDQDVDHVTFTSSNPSVVSLSPASDNTYPFQTTATGVAVGGPVTITAGIFLKLDDGVQDCSGTATATVEELVNAWFQTSEGDVHAGGDINSSIPSTATYLNFSLRPTGSYPGIVSYNGSSATFGYGFPSDRQPNHWLAKTSSTRYSYSYFYQLLDSPTTDNFNGELSEITADGVYYSADDVVINNKWNFPSGRKAVVLIDGKLTINKEIQVPVGSSLAIIVKGNIEIKGVVGDKPVGGGVGEPDNIQGIFITDGTFDSNYDGDNSGKWLRVAGIFVAKQFSLKRDLRAYNDTDPAEKFLYRPDLLMNSYSGLWRATNTWQELAP